MGLGLQSKLLRVLQDREVRPVGGNVASKIDVRIIAATHKDLRAEIEEGRFREDLFYRLNVIPVHLPPLRDRPDDIPALAEAFVRKHSGGERRTLSAAAIQRLQAFPWRGNARELENVIERALALSDQPELGPDDLPIEAAARGHAAEMSGGLVAAAAARRLTLREVELLYTEEILKLTGGNKVQAARILGIDRKTLYRRNERQQRRQGEARA
jgi:DNA-binding NtrC family response regulator